jgi:hypothetical protein
MPCVLDNLQPNEHDLGHATFTECALRCLHMKIQMHKFRPQLQERNLFLLVLAPSLKTKETDTWTHVSFSFHIRMYIFPNIILTFSISYFELP